MQIALNYKTFGARMHYAPIYQSIFDQKRKIVIDNRVVTTYAGGIPNFPNAGISQCEGEELQQA